MCKSLFLKIGIENKSQSNHNILQQETLFISVSANNGSFYQPNLKYFGIMLKPMKKYTEMNRFGAD